MNWNATILKVLEGSLVTAGRQPVVDEKYYYFTLVFKEERVFFINPKGEEEEILELDFSEKKIQWLDQTDWSEEDEENEDLMEDLVEETQNEIILNYQETREFTSLEVRKLNTEEIEKLIQFEDGLKSSYLDNLLSGEQKSKVLELIKERHILYKEAGMVYDFKSIGIKICYRPAIYLVHNTDYDKTMLCFSYVRFIIQKDGEVEYLNEHEIYFNI